MKTPLKEEKLTVMPSMLNPEPVINKPGSEAFNTFVNQLKIRAREEYNAFAGLKAVCVLEGLSANVYTKPPNFSGPGKNPANKNRNPVNIENFDRIKASE